MADIPSTMSQQFQYADNIALASQAGTFAKCESQLEADREELNQFFKRYPVE
jgi:hypothetical protein